jgi:5'-deoxynucleotidase YfbR-like HD superfamily hydrolase
MTHNDDPIERDDNELEQFLDDNDELERLLDDDAETRERIGDKLEREYDAELRLQAANELAEFLVRFALSRKLQL